MTYKQLANKLRLLTDEQQECDVNVYVGGQDEYYPIDELTVSEDSDVLDVGHPIIVVDK